MNIDPVIRSLKLLVAHLDKLALAVKQQADAISANTKSHEQSEQVNTEQPPLTGPISVDLKSPVTVSIKGNSDASKKPPWGWRDWIRFSVEVVGLGVLIWYACTTNKMWQTMETTLRESNRNFRTDERAWLGLSFTGANIRLTVGQSFFVLVQVINTGKTPAKNVTGMIAIDVIKRGEKIDFSYAPGHANYRIEAGAIFPQGSITESFEAIHHGSDRAEATVITAPLLAAIMKNQTVAVIHGRIDYSDIFGTKHWTTYCRYVFNPSLISPECTRYNDTDQNQ